MAWLEQFQVVPDWRGKSVSFVDSEGKQHVLRCAPRGCARWNPSAVGAIVGPSLNVVSLRQVERLHREGQLELACVVFPNSCHQLQEPSGVPPPSVPVRPSPVPGLHVGLARSCSQSPPSGGARDQIRDAPVA